MSTAQLLAQFREQCRRYAKDKAAKKPTATAPNPDVFPAGPARQMARQIMEEEIK